MSASVHPSPLRRASDTAEIHARLATARKGGRRAPGAGETRKPSTESSRSKASGWRSAKGIPTVQECFDQRARTTQYDRWLRPFVEAHGRLKMNQVTDDLCREWIAHRLETPTQYGTLLTRTALRTVKQIKEYRGRSKAQKLEQDIAEMKTKA